MCAGLCLGMILVESQEARSPRSQVAKATPQWTWAGALISLFETCYGFDRLSPDDPAGLQA